MDIFSTESKWLRQQQPQRLWHYVTGFALIALAALPLVVKFHRGHGGLTLALAVILIGAFWWVQHGTYRAAATLSRRDWHSNLPDELLGTITPRQMMRVRLLVVLRQRWLWHVLSSLTLLGLALAISGFLGRFPTITQMRQIPGNPGPVEVIMPAPDIPIEKGILRDYITYQFFHDINELPYFPHPSQLVVAFAVLLVVHFSAGLFSAALGMASTGWNGSVARWRLAQIGTSVLLALSFFVIRGTVLGEVYRYPFSDCRTDPVLRQIAIQNGMTCDDMERNIFALRMVESLEQLGVALLDGGATSSAVLVQPSLELSVGSYFSQTAMFERHQFRHGLVLLSAAGIQIGLASLLLWQASKRLSGKKKEAA